MISEEVIAAMNPRTIVVNCGRGYTVDQGALTRALQEKRIAAAVLDVAEVEPLPADSPLWDVPNLLLTPHVAGGMRLEITRRKCVEMAQENLRRYLAGEQLENLVR